MNILYIPQLSMYDKQTNKLTPEADGNVNMMRNTINEWHNHRPDDKFIILLPASTDVINYSFNFNKSENIKYVFYLNYVVSARINRFNFPIKEIYNKLVKFNKPDLIISDVIEIAGNIKQMYKIYDNYEPKLISNIRHLDDEINYSYMFRVIDGIIQSDLTTILSDTMKDNLFKQINKLLSKNISSKLFKKIISFEPSISYNQLNSHALYNNSKTKNNDVIITFPGRLSKGEENRTNWDKFLKAILKIRELRSDFKVYFTDPNNSMPKELKTNLKDWVYTIPKNRVEFLNLLSKTDIVVSLMDVEGFGGISIREALIFGNMPIIPYVHEYKKMAKNSYNGFVASPIKTNELAEKINWAIDEVKLGNKQQWIDNGKYFSVENQFKKIKYEIERMFD